LGFFHQRELGGGNANTQSHTRAAQESAAIHGGQGLAQATAQAVNKRGTSGYVSGRRFFGQ
jgi:hypothetical protein